MQSASFPPVNKNTLTMTDVDADLATITAEMMAPPPPPPTPQQKGEMLKLEEDKLKTNLPGRAAARGGHSNFLQKRLAKGQKFFDSGDYQVFHLTVVINLTV